MSSVRASMLSLLAFPVPLAGCGTDGSSDQPESTERTSSSSSPAERQPDDAGDAPVVGFRAGLPASSVATDTVAEPISAAELTQNDPSQLPAGATLTSPECAEPGDAYVEPTSVAAQQVSIPEGVRLFQAIRTPVEGTAQDPALAGTLFGRCEVSTVRLADGTQVDQTLSPLGLGDVGDSNAGRSLVGNLVAADGQQQGTSTILFADVVDGDRAISFGAVIVVADEPLSEDVFRELEDTFRELVVNAFEYQHDVLG